MLHKYEPYCAEEACAELVPHLENLKARRDEMVGAATETLKALAAGGEDGEGDLTVIQHQMARFDEYGPELDEARGAVRERIQVLIAEALEDIARVLNPDAAAADGAEDGEGGAAMTAITIGEMERVLQRYAEHKPLEVQLQRKKLKERLGISIRVAEQRLKRLPKIDGVEEVDALIAEYTDSEQHLTAPLLLARKHRQNLQGSLFFQIKNALKLDTDAEGVQGLERLLQKAAGFGDDLLAERNALIAEREEARPAPLLRPFRVPLCDSFHS